MSFRRVNRSKKVPGVKLRPAQPSTRKDLRTPDSTWAQSSGLDSDEEISHQDLCPRPFKGFVLCATGIKDKTSLFKLALELGAQSVTNLTDQVTHLVSEGPGSPKYKCALEHRIPIMHPSWIIESHKVWLRGDDVDVQESVRQHRLPTFLGVILCVSGMDDVSRRLEINRELSRLGGTYVKQIERPVKVTHLLCGNTSEGESEKVHYAQKFNSMGEASIKIVWEDWFWDSLKFGGLFDEERYLVTNPRPPPRELPEGVTSPPPPSPTTPNEDGVSSEIQNAETSARAKAPAQPQPQQPHDEDEIASGKRVPAMTLHLWESILKPRGFEVQGGRLIRSPSKSQAAESAKAAAEALRREGSPSRAGPSKNLLSRRGTFKGKDKDLDAAGDERQPISALSHFQRSRSFMPATKDASTPVGGVRQPFQRTATMVRTSSFLQRPVGSIQCMGGMPSDVPIASSSRQGSAAPEDVLTHGTEISDAARTIFTGLRFRALGEARSTSVKNAIEECGGNWVGLDDDDDDVDYIVVRLISGSNIFRQETDEDERAKYRTECWLERCIYQERVCLPEEHITFTPLKIQIPIHVAEEIVLTFSGLDPVELFTYTRLVRALGFTYAPKFSRHVTHLLCPSGEGAKADKAREWGTPIVDLSWLANIATTGDIPSISPIAEGRLLDLPVASHPREPDEFMASQQHPPAAKTDVKGKGKVKATDATMHDITNAESPGWRGQSLSYGDPPPSAVRPGQAEQMEVEAFGMPNMLLGPAPTPPSARQPSIGSAYDVPLATQSAVEPSEPPDQEDSVSVPSKLYEDRVPSSESPSPLRMPGQRTPNTPNKVTRQATMVIQDRITSLLGKRRSEEEERRLEAQESRLGKRSRPFQRTRSNMSHTSLRGTPASPTSAASPPLRGQSGGSSSKKVFRQPDTSSGEEDHSFLAGAHEDSLRVAYADPRQNGELDRLKILLQADGRRGKEPWEMELGLDLDKELTLPQLPDVVAASSGSGKRPVARGRRGRGRRAGRA
ncbi:hypothetical protein C8Q80DRAFT_1102390 [Daedaleopsis nitida]|nr:hypothetical protein C8Q80DRAFT_1102390 [Daedaleopsis nitida]